MTFAQKKLRAMEALRALTSDLTVAPETTLEALEELRDDIDTSCDAIKEDLARDQS